MQSEYTSKISSKMEMLKQLAEQRKADRLPGHFCIGDFHDGAYDRHDYVSPWSISAHNPDASIMIFLQDWTSADSISGSLDVIAAEIGYTPSLPSNRNLINMLQKHFNSELKDVYVSNLFVFVKPGGMSARIPMRDMLYSATEYALPQIRIVRPRLVICLGAATINAIRRMLKMRPVSLAQARREPVSIDGIPVYGLSHTGGLGVANAGGLEGIDAQWSTLAEAYKALQGG